MVSNLGAALMRLGVVKADFAKTAEADEAALRVLDRAVAKPRKFKKRELVVGDVPDVIFEKMRLLNPDYTQNCVVIPKNYITHLYNSRVAGDRQPATTPSSILKDLLRRRDSCVCESTRAFMERADDPYRGIRAVIAHRYSPELMNFGVFSPEKDTGRIMLHTTYRPEYEGWQSKLLPGKKALRNFEAWLADRDAKK